VPVGAFAVAKEKGDGVASRQYLYFTDPLKKKALPGQGRCGLQYRLLEALPKGL
jgi:hypothetical protein